MSEDHKKDNIGKDRKINGLFIDSMLFLAVFKALLLRYTSKLLSFCKAGQISELGNRKFDICIESVNHLDD